MIFFYSALACAYLRFRGYMRLYNDDGRVLFDAMMADGSVVLLVATPAP